MFKKKGVNSTLNAENQHIEHTGFIYRPDLANEAGVDLNKAISLVHTDTLRSPIGLVVIHRSRPDEKIIDSQSKLLTFLN